MKSIYKFVLICSLAFSNSILAQDMIKLKSGEDLQTKVIEIGTTEIKYKKFDNLDGPTYTCLLYTSIIHFHLKLYALGTKACFQN